MFQGNITYELIGDFIAQQFFQINPFNGEVSVRRHLTTDRSQTEAYQVTQLNSIPIPITNTMDTDTISLSKFGDFRYISV